MLHYFSIGGFCSFKNSQDLFLTAYPGTRIKNTKYENNFIIKKNNRVMKSAVIFGANASGKTNLILGLERLMDIIFNGLNLPKNFDDKKLNYFSKEIEFEIGLSDNDNLFEYSIKYGKNHLIYEKFEVNNNIIYEFKNDTLTSKFSKKVSKDILKIFSVKSTDTMLKKLKDFQLKEIEDFIKISNDIKIKRDLIFNLESKEISRRINDGSKLILERKKIDVLNIIKILDSTIENFYFEKLGNKDGENIYEIYFLRTNSLNKFYLGSESEGIKKILNLMIELLEIYNGKTLLIDELDSSISTVSLIKLFNNFINTNKNIDGQLIVTSHNLLLFDNNIFEPQQIYIVNKKDDLSSEVYSLSEFNIRTEKENLYQDFLKGKFGGING